MTSCKFSSSLDTVCPLVPPLRLSSPSRAGSTLSERSSLTSRTISSSARRRLCIIPRAGSETSAASHRGDAPATTARPSLRTSGRSVMQTARSQPSCRLRSLTSSIVSSPPSSPYSTSGRRVSRTVGISQETRSLMRSESTPGSSSASPSTNSLGTWGGASRPMTTVPYSESSPFGLGVVSLWASGLRFVRHKHLLLEKRAGVISVEARPVCVYPAEQSTTLQPPRYSPSFLERLSEKGVQRCRVTNRRQPAGQEQALSSHFVGSRGTVLVSIETFQTVSEEFFSETAQMVKLDVWGAHWLRRERSASCETSRVCWRLVKRR